MGLMFVPTIILNLILRKKIVLFATLCPSLGVNFFPLLGWLMWDRLVSIYREQNDELVCEYESFSVYKRRVYDTISSKSDIILEFGKKQIAGVKTWLMYRTPSGSPPVETTKAKIGMVACGFVTVNIPAVDANTVSNALCAITNRILLPTKVDGGVWDLLNSRFDLIRAGRINPLIPIFPCIKGVTAMPITDWLDTLLPRQRERYGTKENLEEFKAIQATLGSDVGSQEHRSATWDELNQVSMFVKNEMLLAKHSREPRAISDRNDIYAMVVGSLVKPISKQLACEWNIGNSVTYSSGLTPEQLGTWFDQAKLEFAHRNHFILETDFSRFDATVSKQALVLERLFYKLFSDHNDPQTALALKAISRQTETVGVWDDHKGTTLTYAREGSRKSGDGNTSVGNSLINATIHEFVLSRLLNVKGKPLVRQVKMIVLGDDNLSFIEVDHRLTAVEVEKIKRSLVEDFALLGFKAALKVHSEYKLTYPSFCSGYFIPARINGQLGSIYTPFPGRALTKCGWSTTNIETSKGKHTWLYNAIYGRYVLCGDLPILGTYYKQMLTLCEQEGSTGRSGAYEAGLKWDWYKATTLQQVVDQKSNIDSKIKSIQEYHHSRMVGESTLKASLPTISSTPETYQTFANIYGVSVSQLLDCEKFIKTITKLDVVINHPVLNRIQYVDWEIGDYLTELGVSEPSALRPSRSLIRTDANTMKFIDKAISDTTLTRALDGTSKQDDVLSC